MTPHTQEKKMRLEPGYIVRIPKGTIYNDNQEYWDGEEHQPMHKTRKDKIAVVEFAYEGGGRMRQDRDEFCVNVAGQRSHFFFQDDVDALVREDHSLSEIYTRRLGSGWGGGGLYGSTAHCSCGEKFGGNGCTSKEIREDHREHALEVVENEFNRLTHKETS